MSTTTPSPARRTRRERNRLVESQLGLAEHIAYDYRNRGVELDDLRQVAFLALVRAADRFDETRGTKFSSYASVSINGELKRYFRDHGWSVRPPRSMQELYLRIRREEEQLCQELGRSPTVEELADRSDVDADQVLVALSAKNGFRCESLDVPVDDDAPGSVEPPTVEIGYEHVQDRLDVERLVEPLDERQRRIVELRFGEQRTQSAIAAEIGVSQVQVSRLLARIAHTLRERASRASSSSEGADEVSLATDGHEDGVGAARRQPA